MEHIVGWNVLVHAHLLEQSLLVVDGTTDVLLPPEYAREVYERAPERKEIFWVETHNHVELYGQIPYVPQALDRVVPWLEENLKVRVSAGGAA